MDNLMEQIQSYVNTFSEPLDEEESDMNIDIQKIEEKIKKGFDDIFFIDDSHKNVSAVKKLKISNRNKHGN
jgi:hypothetical protein